ncbi:polynucleotidyl transferase [Striga asiatica]|uniref:Polynucleotidyl transferase n=1 Tax=Striga asiatica TaxID=4170 RepID=A0A5A7PKS8_STRAF|nr:polynucleotidyl transferase [Striga asiatica]
MRAFHAAISFLGRDSNRSMAALKSPDFAYPARTVVHEMISFASIVSKRFLASFMLPHLAYISRIELQRIRFECTHFPNFKSAFFRQADNKPTNVMSFGFTPISESICKKNFVASSAKPFRASPLIIEFQETASLSGMLANTRRAASKSPHSQ